MRSILKTIAIIFVVAVSVTSANESPNIVLIISDDQTYRDFGFTGSERVHTPHLDALAKTSARFVNGTVPTSVCRPSLVTLLTGLYPHQHGVHFNHGPPGNSGYNRMTSREEYERVRQREFYLIETVATLPRLLSQRLGYRCLQTGKFWEGHWRNGGFTEGMTIFEPPPGQTFGGVRTLASGEKAAHGNGDFGLKIGRETMAPISEFIIDCEKDNTPWLVWYAPYLPHQPHDSPAKFYELAKAKPGVEAHEIPYFAAIAQFDDTVGELMRIVEDREAMANTIFVFVIDNGWTPSRKPARSRPVEFEHTKESKRAPFEDGLRTPILIRWDAGGVKAATHNEPISSIDIVPTLLRAAGLSEHAAPMPGINLLPAARGKSPLDPDRPLFGEIYPGDATSLGHPERDIAYRWVRKGDHKLIVPHVQGKAARPWGGYLENEPTLFDLRSDPLESKNVVRDPGKQEIAKELQRLLAEWWNPES